MADLVASALTDWEPILSSLKRAITLSEKLYNMIQSHAENKLITKQILKKINRIHANILHFSQGSEITILHSTIAGILDDETMNVNEAIGALIPEMEKKILSFFRSTKINTEIKGILQRVITLENALSNFGMQLDLRKQQAGPLIQVDQRTLNENKMLRAFLQLHNLIPISEEEGIALQTPKNELPKINYEDVENDQVRLFSMIPTIIQQIQLSQMHENYKTELIVALKNAEKSWRYSRDDFVIHTIGNELQLISGSGGFKNVYEGKLNMKSLKGDEEISSIPVAVLEYALIREDLEMHKGSLLREIYLSWRFDHPCIVNTFGAFWPSEAEQGLKPKIFSELMTHNLRNGRHNVALKDKLTRYSIAIDVAEGLLYLHRNGFVHRDIKPENILLRINGDALVCRAKICDFGASKEMRTTSFQQSVTVNAYNQHTPIFAPPEEFKNEKTSYEYDLWGFGLILCWLDGDESLQLRARPGTVPFLAHNGELVKMTKAWVSSIKNRSLRNCAKQCTNEDPKRRGTMSDIISSFKSSIALTTFQKGLKLYEKKKYVKSVVNFRMAAGWGNGRALYYLARCYLEGKGTKQDCELAVKLFSTCFEKGDADAEYCFRQYIKDGVQCTLPLTQHTLHMHSVHMQRISSGVGFQDHVGAQNELSTRMRAEEESQERGVVSDALSKNTNMTASRAEK